MTDGGNHDENTTRAKRRAPRRPEEISRSISGGCPDRRGTRWNATSRAYTYLPHKGDHINRTPCARPWWRAATCRIPQRSPAGPRHRKGVGTGAARKQNPDQLWGEGREERAEEAIRAGGETVCRAERSASGFTFGGSSRNARRLSRCKVKVERARPDLRRLDRAVDGRGKSMRTCVRAEFRYTAAEYDPYQPWLLVGEIAGSPSNFRTPRPSAHGPPARGQPRGTRQNSNRRR
jgi:hypothetical protein